MHKTSFPVAPRPVTQRLAAWLLLAFGLSALPETSLSAAETGGLVRLRLPLEGAGDQVFQGVLQRTADKLSNAEHGTRRPVLVIEFDPAGDQGASEFERCLSLSRFILRELTGVKTVAYLPRGVSGHAVLVALACEEIAMAPDAEIGAAAAGEDPARAVEPGMAAVYQETAQQRGVFPPAVALAMVDRRVELLKIEDETGVDFILSADLPEREARRAVASTEVVSAAGELAVLTGREAREYGFAKYLTNAREGLARVLDLPVEALREDQATLAEWRPVMIEIRGAVTPRLVKQVKTLIGSETTQGKSNWIGLRINSGGGPIDQCLDLAQVIAALDPDDVRTVAYVPVEAAGGASLVALACDQLIMHPGAKLGGGVTVEARAPRPGQGRLPPPRPPRPAPQRPEPEGPDPARLTQEQLDAARTSIQNSLGESAGRSWSLLAAMIDPQLKVFKYDNRKTGQQALFSEAEASEQPNPGDWRQGEEITAADKALVLDAGKAANLGVALQLVDTFDELKQLYGFTSDPPLAKPNWALEFVEALAHPWLAGVLLLIGFGGVYFELNTPGLGIGGFVASVAFMLFFWSHFLSGTAEWLEVMLFVAGVFFILMEVFVLPGFGIFGLGGAAMVLASLVLVSQTFVIPKSAGQLTELRESLTMVVGAMVATLVAGFVFRQYLPHAPGMRHLMQPPPSDVEIAEQEHRETLADYTHLIGKSGEAVTNLMPGGRAEIDGELVDVIADGLLVDRGDRVVVTSARGSRVMVKKV